MKRAVLVCCLLLAAWFMAVTVWAEGGGVPRIRPKPQEYGNVVIDNASTLKGKSPVLFMHWLHRSKYTCRLCHIDIGFAMSAGGTGITCRDIQDGLYCGSCHNGKESFAREDNCDRCHSLGKPVVFKNDFYDFKKGLPRERFGNGIDWMKAEDEGRVKLKDYLPGISIKKKKLSNPKDQSLESQNEAMPNIIFSHKKHAVWNGCEVCHPDIFSVKRGESVYSMADIFDGRYCGVCHGRVAFPNQDCQRCHTDDVQ